MIRAAKISEARILTRIAFESKGYWGYPREFFDIWAKELTISPDDIQNKEVFVFEKVGVIIGYYSIVELTAPIEISDIRIGKGFWLEHMFIEPTSIRKGIGTKLFEHLKERCRARRINELGILADPNSRGFYERMGCVYQCEYRSTIKDRTTPFLRLKIRRC